MRQDRVHREQYEKALTLADLCQGIERRIVPSVRDGDEYVVRVADVRRLREMHALHERLQDDGLETTPGCETSSLEVGRPA